MGMGAMSSCFSYYSNFLSTCTFVCGFVYIYNIMHNVGHYLNCVDKLGDPSQMITVLYVHTISMTFNLFCSSTLTHL